MANKKVIFYYDGFNFYRGLKSAGWKECYWLDLYEFSKNLISKWEGYEVIWIHYFTARPHIAEKRFRQNMWLNTNQKLHDNIEVHYGKYKPEIVYCTNPKCKRKMEVPKEKQTDVNIAVNLMHDCIKQNCDVSVLISGDNDLLPPIKYIFEQHPEHRTHIFYPPNRNKSNLHDYTNYKPVHLLYSKEVFLKSKLNRSYNFNDGKIYLIPPEWEV